MEIRAALQHELAAIGELTVHAYISSFGPAELGDYVEHLRDAAGRAREATLLVAADATGLLGTVTYVPSPSSALAEDLRDGEAGIRMLAVAPEARGRGLGRALAVACIERARADGRLAIRLHTRPIMHAARHIYEQLGFGRDASSDWEPVPGLLLLGYVLDLTG